MMIMLLKFETNLKKCIEVTKCLMQVYIFTYIYIYILQRSQKCLHSQLSINIPNIEA